MRVRAVAQREIEEERIPEGVPEPLLQLDETHIFFHGLTFAGASSSNARSLSFLIARAR